MEPDSRSHSATPVSADEHLEDVLREELPAHMVRTQVGGFVWDIASDRIHLDRGALAVFELDPHVFDGTTGPLRARILACDLLRLEDMATARVNDFGVYFRVRSSHGGVRWTHARASITRDEQGRALRAVGVVRGADAELAEAAEQIALQAERGERTDVVQAVTGALSRVLTVDDLVNFLTGQLFLDVFGASGVLLCVLEEDRRRMLATRGLPVDLQADLGVVRINAPLPIPEAIRDQKAMFVTRQEVQERYPLLWPYIEPTDLRATAILPLAAEGRPTGALCMLWDGDYVFDANERSLLFALSATVAQSLQRALLYDREHAMSVTLQQSMLPSHTPEVPGLDLAVRYQPTHSGQQVGGDWYDVIPLNDGRIMLAVGDVQGHDARSAAVMGQLRSVLRAYATEGHPPEAVMARASRFLEDLETDLISTCICVHLDPETGSARIVRAGHPDPIVRLRDGGADVRSTAGGLPLGLARLADEPYTATDLRLEHGDTLLLCTDGLLELRGSDMESGVRQVRNLLEEGEQDLEVLADSILEAVERSEGQRDDIALILATRTQPIPASRL